MKQCYLVAIFLCSLLSVPVSVFSQSGLDTASMQALKVSLGNPESLNWTDPDPCQWKYVKCLDNRVTHLRLNQKNLTGSLPPDLKNLFSLKLLDVTQNFLLGPIPSLAGLRFLLEVHLSDNNFSSVPTDFFSGLTSLQLINLDYNPFSSWEIPESLKDAKELHTFSAKKANISGTIPDFLGGYTNPKLRHLLLSSNHLEGPIPSSFGNSSIQTLWLNGQASDSKLNGSLSVLENMTSVTELWLHGNHFTGPLPDFSRLTNLEYLSLRNNQLTGIFPPSLFNLPKLKTVCLANNFFQGPAPKFESKVDTDKALASLNSFCSEDPGAACDSRVNILLSIAKSMGYPLVFAKNWRGNDPCKGSQAWNGISCNGEGSITVVNFQNLQLQGTISPDFSMLRSAVQFILSDNSLSGTIPSELTSLPNLTRLDVSNNNLYGEVPNFVPNVVVNIDGNPRIEEDSVLSPEAAPENNMVNIPSGGRARTKKSNTAILLGSAFTGAFLALFIFGLGLYFYEKKQNNSHRIHRLKTVVINPREARTSDIPADAFGNMVISIQVLREVTNNFSVQNILGRGGFGTVYKGEVLDGRKIAVKRMEVIEIASNRGLKQFKSEIAVLTKVRHRHLVALLGYCLDGNERLLVYEFMPQGTLSRHLFNWKEMGLKPLDWSRRLIIALDVARGVEYLHGLAHESFIHRDLKPSNILLGDDMRAKVADFGLVRLAPENGKNSTETRIAGTFGYLAPEYLVTGRVTTKVDVFSFGVILMELITGRGVVDETQSDPENAYLVTWFRSKHVNEDNFRIAIDETIELDEETLASVNKVAELADQCCASQPYQRPDMGRVVTVLSSLAELQKPIQPESS